MIAYMPETLSSLDQQCQGFSGRRGFQEAHLIDAALRAGGSDNVTVVLIGLGEA